MEKQKTIPSVWKEVPDLYFSWALSCCTIAEGHLFVDLLPQSTQLYGLSKEEKETLSKRFEGATREYLDTKHVVRVLCDAEMTPDFFYFLLATNIQQLEPMQQSKSREEENRSRGTTQSSRYKVLERQRSKAKSQKKSIKSRAPSIHHSPAPLVFILQDVELLSHRTQMALVEIMTRKFMPVSFVPNLVGGTDSSVLVPGHFDIKIPLVIVGLSDALLVPQIEYNPHDRGLSNLAGISPQLFQAFLMRIPIKMPDREVLTSPGFQLVVFGQGDDEPFGGPKSMATKPTTKFLWPKEMMLVANHPVAKPSQFDNVKPHRINRLDIRAIKETADAVHLSFEMEMHLQDIITALRMHPFVLSGPSSLSYTFLVSCVKAVASFVKGKTYATPADVVDVVGEVLGHQIILSIFSFPQAPQAMESSRLSHPKDWHPLTTSRYVVAQSAQFYVPAPR